MASSGRTQEALAELRAAATDSPDDAQAHFHLAEALRQSPRAQEALPHYQRALAIDPQMVEARFGYAMTLVLLKRYEEARSRLADDAKRYPEHPEFAQALARLR
jgi:Flp pilus assembly protein TadD